MSAIPRLKVLSEARQVVRPVSISMLAIGTASCAMAGMGWGLMSLVMGGIILLVGCIMIFHVHYAVRQLNSQSELVRQAADEAEQHYVAVLRRVLQFVEARYSFTRGRSIRVGFLAEQIARKLKLDEQTCMLMNVIGQLNDIGMLAVPEAIMNKASRLGADEYRTLQRHCQIGYDILKPLGSLRSVLPAILHHHERMNGSGYPKGLRGDEIPLPARILAVADAYDAMTHDRPHRPAMSPLEAMKELRRCTPAGYDSTCVAAMAEIIHLNDLQPAQPQRAELVGAAS